MAAFSTYLETQILLATLKGQAFAPVLATVYVSLHTSDPGDTDAGTGEVATGASNYSRATVQAATWGTPSPGTSPTGNLILANANAPIQFATPGTSWGTVGWFGIWDSATAGHLLYHGNLTATKTVNANDSIQFGAGDLQISLD